MAGLTAAQMSMNGWPTTSTLGSLADGGGDPALLGPGDEVVDEDAEPPPVLRLEVTDDGRQVVDALQVLHDDADVAQVVAPDLLHQLRVVLALDVDPAGLGDLGPLLRRGDGPGRGPPADISGICGFGAGRTSVTRLPSSRNVPGSGNTRRLPKRSSSVTEPGSTATTAPQNRPSKSSTTRSRSASTCGTGPCPGLGFRFSGARTSRPYCRLCNFRASLPVPGPYPGRAACTGRPARGSVTQRLRSCRPEALRS